MSSLDHITPDEFLHAYLDQELDTAQEQELYALLASDASYHAKLRELRQIRDEALKSGGVLTPPAAVTGALFTRLGMPEYASAAMPQRNATRATALPLLARMRQASMPLAAAASVAFLAGMLVVTLLRSPGSDLLPEPDLLARTEQAAKPDSPPTQYGKDSGTRETPSNAGSGDAGIATPERTGNSRGLPRSPATGEAADAQVDGVRSVEKETETTRRVGAGVARSEFRAAGQALVDDTAPPATALRSAAVEAGDGIIIAEVPSVAALSTEMRGDTRDGFDTPVPAGTDRHRKPSSGEKRAAVASTANDTENTAPTGDEQRRSEHTPQYNSTYDDIEYYASVEDGEDATSMSVEFRGLTMSSFPQATVPTGSDPWMQNLAVAVYMSWGGSALGLEYGQEPFSQHYSGTEDGRAVRYEQNLLTSWITANYRYSFAPLFGLRGLRPFVTASLGSSVQLWPVTRGSVGLTYLADQRVRFHLSADGSLMAFPYDRTWFTSTRAGISYGISVLF